jgi:ACR3 family arsenite transporter
MITLKQLETHQVSVYMGAIFLAFLVGLLFPVGSKSLGLFVTPVLGCMLYGMFSQIPFQALMQAIKNRRFFMALIFSNFVLVPITVWIMTRFIHEAAIQLGVMLVLLTPCIDYVVVFTHLGKGDVKLILAALPILFILQMVLLPLFLGIFLTSEAASLVKAKPFIETFIYLIILPLLIALVLQFLSNHFKVAKKLLMISAWFPVPFTAAILFVVIASQIFMITSHLDIVQQVAPIYFLYLFILIFFGYITKQLFNLNQEAARTLIFSLGNRNSFVVLPFALAIPGIGGKMVALVIVTQTLVELIGQMIYIKIVPKIIRD